MSRLGICVLFFRSIVSLRVLNFKELLMGVSLYKNQVNLSRGIIPFVVCATIECSTLLPSARQHLQLALSFLLSYT